MKVYILGSGSKGNSTLIVSNNKKILIDVGFSYPREKLLLEEYGYKISDIDGILITHDHRDHIGGLAQVVKRHHIKVYVNEELSHQIDRIIDSDDIIIVDNKFDIDDIKIESFNTSHDAKGSVGFIINVDDKSMVYVTDTGYINSRNLKKLVNKNLYVFESNHDIKMLMDGPYPYILKQRILSDKGHLSNELAGNYLNELIGDNTKKIVLAHLSETNNDPDIAYKTVNDIIKDKNVVLLTAYQDKSIEVGDF